MLVMMLSLLTAQPGMEWEGGCLEIQNAGGRFQDWAKVTIVTQSLLNLSSI